MQNQSPIKLYYVSAPAGSGKTHGLTRHAATLAASDNRKVIIAQPTTELIRQTAADLRALKPELAVTTIYKVKPNEAVGPRIEDHLRNADKSTGQVLLITHEALKRLPNAYRAHWDLFVDEFPTVFDCISLNVVKTHQLLTQHIELDEDVSNGISGVKIQAGHFAAIEDIIINKADDELLDHFKELCRDLVSENRTVLVETQSYNELLTGKKESGEVNFFSLLDSSFVEGYSSVTFLGANAKETELFILWSHLNQARFVQHPLLAKGLRYKAHPNGQRLTIHYLFENEWSKTRSQVINQDTGETLLAGIERYIGQFFAGQNFLWVANKSVEMLSFNQNNRLPPVSLGLNKPHFMSCNAVASTIALVHNRASSRFLGLLGLSDHQIRTIICYQSEYQAIMRCSLRDPDAIAPVAVIVPSRSSAEWIGGKFPGCSINKLQTGLDWELGKPGRPAHTKRKTRAEYQKAYRERQKRNLGRAM